MAGHEHSQVRPHTSQDTTTIASGSPLAVQGIFLEVLRERFRTGLPWVWNADPTLTEVLIEVSFNPLTETRNQTPAIYVTRTVSQPVRTVIGDRVGVRLPDHLEGFAALMRIGLQLECVSNDEGESSIIGDTVQFTVLAAQDVIQREFGFYSMDMPVLGQTTPYDRDQKKWSSPVTFGVEFWIRWSQVPIAPLLQQLYSRISLADRDVFVHSVLNSTRRGGT